MLHRARVAVEGCEKWMDAGCLSLSLSLCDTTWIPVGPQLTAAPGQIVTNNSTQPQFQRPGAERSREEQRSDRPGDFSYSGEPAPLHNPSKLPPISA